MKKDVPSMDAWLREAKAHESAPKIGMYLTHNGVVRRDAKAKVRQGAEGTRDISGIYFNYDEAAVETTIEEVYQMPGIYYVRVWLNRGKLAVGMT